MVSWTEDGTISGFVRVTDLSGARPSAAVYDSRGYRLATNGVVNLNGITRFQYDVTDFTEFYTNAFLNITAGDVAAYPGRTFTASYFIAAASAVPATPTVAQIIAAASIVARAQGGAPDPHFRTTAGNISAFIYTPFSTSWNPNAKLWVATVPTHVSSMATAPSVANDLPVGDPNVTGRAVSMWTNRTPGAPSILTPGPQTTTFAGSEITLTFKPGDPDRVSSFPGDSRPNDFDDVAGMQIQYAPLPTVVNPTPTWIDMPITNTLGTSPQRGWYIKHSATAPPADGAKVFCETYTMKIRCGSTSYSPSAGVLPSGNWQVRIRTFDFGHPMPSTIAPVIKPLNQDDGLFTPDTYPAVNTSPWSTPVKISVSDQVPPPVPLYPINNIAIPEPDVDVAVRLTWQYRNTYMPPYPQTERVVYLRRVGDVTWYEFEAVSALNYVNIVNLGVGHWEWQVQTRDASGIWSYASAIARFWIVAAPQSGEVRPVPSGTIDGATLGCGTHTIQIFRRGGKDRTGVLTGVSYVDWSRVRDDISTSKIVVSDWDVDCGNLLSKLQCWAYEVVITRDNGFSKDRVWEGPITLLTYEVDKVTIEAKDVIGYAYRRIIKQAMSDRANGATVTERATQVLLNAFAPDDPNVLAYLNTISADTDAMQYRSIPAYSRTAFEEIDDMAANAGLDYTAVGRSILLWGTKHRIGTLPEFKDADLGSPPIVSEYGMSMANRYVVSDGNGVWGEATRGLDVSGNDETYGLVEMLSSTWASDSESETGTYTQEGTETIIESFKGYAERSIADKYPPPVVVRVPDNTTLNPGTLLSIQQLVPGVVIPLRSTGTLRTVVADQKLDSVKMIEQDGEEKISITLSPFSEPDVEEEE